MNNIIQFVILLFSILLIPFSLLAEDLTLKKTLQIRGDWAYPPYEFINDSGEPDGFNVEIISAVMEELDYPYEIKLENWVDVKDKYLKGQIDVITGMIYNGDRARTYNLGDVYCYVNYSFVCRKGNIINSLKSAVGNKCFVQSGEVTMRILTDNGVSLSDITSSYDNIDILKRLAAGEGDLAFCSNDIAQYVILKYGLTNLEIIDVGIDPLEYRFVSNDLALLEDINNAYYKIKRNGRYDTIYNKWFGKNKSTNISGFIYIIIGILLSVLLFFFVFVYLLNKKVHLANKQISQQNRQLEYLLHINNLDLKKYQTVFDSTLTGIEVYDKNGVLIDINDSYCEIFGITDKDNILNAGFSISENPVLSDLFSVGSKTVYRDVIRYDLRKSRRSKYFKHSLRDEVLFVDTRISPITDENGNLENIICTYIDQTAVYKHNEIMNQEQDKLTKALTQLNIEKEKAQRADKLKSAFLANMSHEIRTPLNAIAGFAHLLPNIKSAEKLEEYLYIIDHNKEMLLQLIDDILDLSKIDSGLIELNRADFDLSSLFKELHDAYKTRLNDKRIDFILSDKYAKCIIYTDKKRLYQILSNFISNAVKCTDEGSIEIGYNIINKGVRMYIKDTGKGISKENHHRVFGRFEKFDDFVQGTGLGLAISKALAHMAGGKTGFNSETGVGSEFWVWLPIIPTEVEVRSVQTQSVSIHSFNNNVI